LQDGVFDLIEAGKVMFAYATAFSLSEERVATLKDDLALHRDKILLRPQEISNHPEIIRRLGIISFNTALEVDIYGNVNSTHLNGTHMMNGIGGSGDFARNARISIFVTPSTAKNGNISTIVPFVSHIDHPNHDIDVIVTELGYADLRVTLLAPAPHDARIHRPPRAGGPATRITEDDGRLHFLHGISPDGATLVYTSVARCPDGAWLPPVLAVVPATGGRATLLTED